MSGTKFLKFKFKIDYMRAIKIVATTPMLSFTLLEKMSQNLFLRNNKIGKPFTIGKMEDIRAPSQKIIWTLVVKSRPKISFLCVFLTSHFFCYSEYHSEYCRRYQCMFLARAQRLPLALGPYT